MDFDDGEAKLFVGGISRDTSEDVLRDHFSNYGSVLSSSISIDRSTRIPRGFGFVRFSNSSAADKALRDTHVILGRTVDVKKAIPRSEQKHLNQLQGRGTSNYRHNDCRSNHNRTKKIFVGGLYAGISEEDFKKYFESFGRITDVVVMEDSVTHRPRGFGFITFDSEESVEKVLVKSFHDLNGRQVEVKRAVPKEWNHGNDGFNRLSYKGGTGTSKTFSHHSSPRYILPDFAPQSWYGSRGVYVYGSSNYGCWYPMGGYGGNGYAVPFDASMDFWHGSMLTCAQYSNALPSLPHAGGRFGMVGSGARTKGYNGILGSATNLKVEPPFSSNVFVAGNGTSPPRRRQDVESSGFKGSSEVST